jgi:Type IV secretion-system coupling protein DNA-binding domain
LQRLPQLHTALTENRKSGNPVVIGFQGRSQLEVWYGHQAEAMLSQPATKIFLHTSEPRAAKWISDTIGEVEMERLQENLLDDAFYAALREATNSVLVAAEASAAGPSQRESRDLRSSFNGWDLQGCKLT